MALLTETIFLLEDHMTTNFFLFVKYMIVKIDLHRGSQKISFAV
jgi:hypothetical protein